MVEGVFVVVVVVVDVLVEIELDDDDNGNGSFPFVLGTLIMFSNEGVVRKFRLSSSSIEG